MPKRIDITGQVFGKLTAIKTHIKEPGDTRVGTFWECICACGEARIVQMGSLRSGNTRSCGCYNMEVKTKHKMCFTREYRSWQGMKKRCYGNEGRYKQYREKGIVMCEEWLNSFEAFYSDMGAPPSKKHTIDRIENDKGYYKENCRWATQKEQNRNYSQNRILIHNGVSKSITEWAEHLGVDRHLIYNRLVQKWNIEDALFKPKQCIH